MLDLILQVARADEWVRAVILNGSRANPNAPRDIFQDYDIQFLVTEIESFKKDPAWINVFGELMIMQKPDDMQGAPPQFGYCYLMQFQDGNRIDLNLFPIQHLPDMQQDSLTFVLLDKDGLFPHPPPPSEKDYLPQHPSSQDFSDCCNEFWWVSVYVAKGLWREQITYALAMLSICRDQLLLMLSWQVGLQTGFRVNLGKDGKYLQQNLSSLDWERLLGSYPRAKIDEVWQSLYTMCALFHDVAIFVGHTCQYHYPEIEDERISSYLRHIQSLPKDAMEIF